MFYYRYFQYFCHGHHHHHHQHHHHRRYDHHYGHHQKHVQANVQEKKFWAGRPKPISGAIIVYTQTLWRCTWMLPRLDLNWFSSTMHWCILHFASCIKAWGGVAWVHVNKEERWFGRQANMNLFAANTILYYTINKQTNLNFLPNINKQANLVFLQQISTNQQTWIFCQILIISQTQHQFKTSPHRRNVTSHHSLSFL